MTGASVHFWTASDEVRLAYHQMGEGPLVILLHGLFSINWPGYHVFCTVKNDSGNDTCETAHGGKGCPSLSYWIRPAMEESLPSTQGSSYGAIFCT